MRSKIFYLCCLSMLCNSLFSQNKTIAERLGYDANAKLLIIHADDLGVAHSENRASIKGLEDAPVNSASIMVPCPWFPEIAKYARNNKNTDLGIHLTLNCEWNYYKWGPVTPRDSVATLVDENGYLFANVQDVVQNANPEEVALEMRNQIKKAYESGIDITHLDAHMGTAISTTEFLASYIKLGKEFKLPVLLGQRIKSLKAESITKLIDDTVIMVDAIHGASPADYEKGMAQYYTQVLDNLDAGLNVILVHLAYDDEEMKAVTVEHDYWNSAWRQADMDFFNSPECAALLEKKDIILVTWRELRDKIVRGN